MAPPRDRREMRPVARFKSEGKLRHVARSWLSLGAIGARVSFRHLMGRQLVPKWSRDLEVGTLFWRGQFARAMAMRDMDEGRACFDSLQTYADDAFDTRIEPGGADEPKGDWFIPAEIKSSATILYLHGGGYTFYAAVTRHFIAMLAAHLGVRIFAPDYRLTPEHPHPAQIEDSVAAYRFLLARGVKPAELVVAGDSAGGHLTFMTLIALRDRNLPQPALAVGLCSWTDIGARGASFYGNDKYDLVQGWMALKFGEWLKGSSGFSNEELSPIHHNFNGLAPLYLQGGGKEVLIDMIRDFAKAARDQGCDVTLDVWEHMTHNFQAHGASLPESREALERLARAIRSRTEGGIHFGPCEHTEVRSGQPIEE
jgi:epsilon-lactone hydrolase